MAEPRLKTALALVGSETLAGREVRDVLASTRLGVRLRLIGAGEDDAAGSRLSLQEGEPVVVSALDEDNLTGAGIVMLAGSPVSSRKALALLAAHASRPDVIDVTGGLEDRPEARLRAPQVEPRGFSVVPGAIHVIAHPAAVALALLLKRLPEANGVFQLFLPASERGQAGVSELQNQVVNLLTFKPLPKEVFDEQIGFNLLPRYGDESAETLAAIEDRISRHLASLLAGGRPAAMPSLRVAQAPVFHGYTISAWLRFEHPVDPRKLAEDLATAQIEVRTADQGMPTNVGAAGQSGLTVGPIEPDRNCRQAVWLWAVADNLRLLADSAVEVARQLVEARHT